MIDLPETTGVPVIRADFSADTGWETLKQDIHAPAQTDGFEPISTFVEERALAGLDETALVASFPPDAYPDSCEYPLVIVADRTTFTHPERPLLLISLSAEDEIRSFRARPHSIEKIAVNLAIANMDWEEFAEVIDPDGIFWD